MGRVEEIGPGQFLAIVSAVPNKFNSESRVGVEFVAATTHQDAWSQLETLAVSLGEKVRREGGRIVEIEVE